MIGIVLLCIACAAAHRFGRHAAFTDTGMLHPMAWLVASGTYLFFTKDLIEPSATALLTIGLGIVSFSAGSFAAARWTPRPAAASLFMPPAGMTVLTGVAAVAFGAMLFQALRMAPPSGQVSWLSAVRIAATAPGGGFGLAGYLANAGFAASLVAVLLARDRTGRWLAAAAGLFAVGCAILLTGRTFIILVAVLLGVALASRGRDARLPLLGIGLSGACLLVVITVLQARSATGAGSLLAGLRYEWLHYVPVGLAAFAAEVARAEPLQWGTNTFRTGFAVLRALGADVHVVSLVRPYIPVPMLTNVYTAFSPYHADFGPAGVGIAFALFGAASSAAQIRSRGGRPATIMLHVILLYALAMQFFQDQYASLASQWVQLLAFTLLFTLPARRA